MPVMRSYQCPDCQGIFDHLHMRSTDEPPAFCPLCGASTGDVQPEISAPRIAKPIGKTGDAVYRGMEDGSAQRAAMAAEHLGCDVSDMSAMKVTDIKDNTREGETSNVVAANPVSNFMAQTGVGGLQSSTQAAAFAASTNSGPYARAGESARQGIVANHQQRAAQVARAGQQGSYIAGK